jgi:uncharacterized protein YndB with AHSA1/START domain
VTITFAEIGEKTKVTIRYVVESAEVLEVMRKTQMAEGWDSSLDKLERVASRS